jgi:cytoskeletal protein CcmA (bactofilin family)
MVIPRKVRPLLYSTELSEHVKMEGNLRTEASLLIKGSFSGTIESVAHITIENGAAVDSCTLSARSLSVFGRFSGSIKASGFVELGDKASVSAEVEAPAMSVSSASRFEGHITMLGNGD